jgi:hypothetical protein
MSSAMMRRGLGELLEQGQQVLEVGQLLLVHEDVGVVHDALHPLGVGHEVGGEVAAVELHTLDDLVLGVQALGLLDRDDTVLADLAHDLGQDVADGAVSVGADGADLGHLGLVVGRAGLGHQLLDHGLHGGVDAALEVHGVGAGHDELGALAVDALGQHGGGGGAVSGDVVGLGGDLLDHLGAHVLGLVLQLDLLGHGHAVLGDDGGAEALVEHDVAALGTEGGLDGVGELVDAGHQGRAGGLVEVDVLGGHGYS